MSPLLPFIDGHVLAEFRATAGPGTRVAVYADAWERTEVLAVGAGADVPTRLTQSLHPSPRGSMHLVGFVDLTDGTLVRLADAPTADARVAA